MEDLTTYTKYDPNGRLDVIDADSCYFTSVYRNETVYLNKDFTADYFSEGFTTTYHFAISTHVDNLTGIIFPQMMSMADEDVYGNNNCLGSYAYTNFAGGYRFFILALEVYGGAMYDSGTPYITFTYPTESAFITAIRDMDVGTYGTYTIYGYTDEERTNLRDDAVITLHGHNNFRHFQLLVSYNDGQHPYGVTGYIQNVTQSVPVDVVPWYYYAQ